MQWLASDSSLFFAEGTAPSLMPKKTTLFGRSPASDAVREQSALRQSVASGTAETPVRTFSRVWVTSP